MSSGDCEDTRGPSSLQPTQRFPQMCTNVGETGGNMTPNRLGVRKGKNKKSIGHRVNREDRIGPSGGVRQEVSLTSLPS